MVQPIAIELDETRYLLYRSEHLEAFEDQLGGQSWQRALVEQGEKRLRLIIWAGLRWRQKTVTPQQVGEMLDKARAREVQLVDLWRAIALALQASGFLPPGSVDQAESDTEDPLGGGGLRPVPSPGPTPRSPAGDTPPSASPTGSARSRPSSSGA